MIFTKYRYYDFTVTNVRASIAASGRPYLKVTLKEKESGQFIFDNWIPGLKIKKIWEKFITVNEAVFSEESAKPLIGQDFRLKVYYKKYFGKHYPNVDAYSK